MTRTSRRTARRAAAAVVLAGLVGGLATTAADASPTRFTRNYGVDRYMTSAIIDDDPTATAYVVSGDAFPDGLAAGAVAGQVGGNVYLTRQGELPQAVRERIIYASKIVVVGGEKAVGPAVMSWLQQNTRGALSRVNGDDRFATAAALSAVSFASLSGATGVANVVIATGDEYPDALAGSAAAAKAKSPLLLVRRDEVPSTVAAELARLKPQAITVVGGNGRVSDAVLARLRSFTTGPVDRVAGADRYETADLVSAKFFPNGTTLPDGTKVRGGAARVTLASGETFADALAAGAFAGRRGGPLLLTASGCVTEQTNLEIERLQAPFGEDSVLNSVGGPDRISENAARRTNCQPAGTPAKTYLEDLTYVEGSARTKYDHATINGRFYPRSVAYDADPRNSDYASWTLDGKFSRFTAVAGVADDNASSLASTVQVFGDEKLLASAEVSKGKPAPLSVDVRGLGRLKIVTTTPNASLSPKDPTANNVYIGDGAVN